MGAGREVDSGRPVEEVMGRVNVVGGNVNVNAAATITAKSGPGDLIGIHVNSTSSGVLKIWDNTASSGTVLINTYSPAAGWNPMPLRFRTGLQIQVVSGTIDYTVSFS